MTTPDRADDVLHRVIDATLARLETTGRLSIHGDRADVAAALTDALAGALAALPGPGGAASVRDGATLADFLDRAADADAGEWRHHAGAPYASAHVDEARRQAALTHMRLEQGGITREQAATYFASLARALRERDAAP